MQGTFTWLQQRKKSIGGSEVFDVLFGSRNKILEDKFGVNQKEESEYTKRILKYGKDYELLAECYFKALIPNGHHLWKLELQKHKKYKFLSGSFDGIYTTPSNKNLIVELKCPFKKKYDTPSIKHYLQVQHYIQISGYEEAILFYFYSNNKEIKADIFLIKSDQETYETYVIPILKEFYQRMKKEKINKYTRRDSKEKKFLEKKIMESLTSHYIKLNK